MSDCPCCSGQAYEQCCEPLLLGHTQAATAEALMRSRYTAFVLGRGQYLLDTWHISQRPASLDFDSQVKWLGLEVRRHRLLDPDHPAANKD